MQPNSTVFIPLILYVFLFDEHIVVKNLHICHN